MLPEQIIDGNDYLRPEPRRRGRGRREIISGILDVGLPITGAVLGTVSGVPGGTAIGAVSGRVARHAIKKTTGYGRKRGRALPRITKSGVINVAKNVASFGLDTVPTIAGLAGSTHSPVAGLVAQAGTQLARDYIRRKTGVGRPRISKQTIGTVLDYAIPFASSALYNELERRPESATTGRILGHAVRTGVKKLTGVGHYEPRMKKQLREGDRRVIRGAVLSLLYSQGLSFSEASKQ